MPKPPSIPEIQAARFKLEKQALAAIAKDKLAIVRRRYEEARNQAAGNNAQPGFAYLTGRADAWEEILAMLNNAQEGT